MMATTDSQKHIGLSETCRHRRGHSVSPQRPDDTRQYGSRKSLNYERAVAVEAKEEARAVTRGPSLLLVGIHCDFLHSRLGPFVFPNLPHCIGMYSIVMKLKALK